MPSRRPTRRHAARRRPAAKKVDLYRAHPDEYVATTSPRLVRIRRARYLAILGKGRPGTESYQESIGALYTVAFTIKMARRFAGKDFAVSKLEGQYWWNETAPDMPMDECQWQLLIRVPTFVTEREVHAAAARLVEQGKPARIADVRLVNLDEGRCVQMLHVGPYDAEQVTIETMLRFAGDAGLHAAGRHHEIYLSDPRRVASDRLRTILRQPLG